METERVTFGSQLRNIRRANRLSQQELSDALSKATPVMKVSQTAISTWEQRGTAPSETAVAILAEFFDAPHSYFYKYVECDAVAQIAVDDPSMREYALLRLIRRGKYLAAIQLIVNVFWAQDNVTANQPPTE